MPSRRTWAHYTGTVRLLQTNVCSLRPLAPDIRGFVARFPRRCVMKMHRLSSAQDVHDGLHRLAGDGTHTRSRVVQVCLEGAGHLASFLRLQHALEVAQPL